MTDNGFFKLTPLYKEFMLLDMIEKNSNITQRDMSATLGVALSMINSYLDEYEENGLIKRKYKSAKIVEYFVTNKGIERRKLLNIWYLKSSHAIYQSAVANIIKFLNQIIEKGFKNILLYGAGEVAEILLSVVSNGHHLPVSVLAIVDDDAEKQNQVIGNTKVIAFEQIKDYQYDGILISSYTHNSAIMSKLLAANYDIKNIITFF